MPHMDSPSVGFKQTSSSELQSVRTLAGKLDPRMAETSVVVDPCYENRMCSSNRPYITDSNASLYPCSCGPDCSPDKCAGQKTSLVSWDETRTRLFLVIIAAFAIWMLIYIPISVSEPNWK